MDERALRAVREGVAATRASHMTTLRLSGGDGAWETVSELTSGELFLRDGQVLNSLWLDEEAHPLADVYVVRDDEAFVIVGETARAEGIAAHARANVRGATVLDDLSSTHEVVSLTGPFAWELMGEIVGPEVVGLPYLGAFAHDGGWILRAGKTGEYGYDLVLPRPAAAKVLAKIDELAPRFDIVWADLDVLEQCMLENWFFNVRREGRGDVTPLELQLQWRTTRGRSYVGAGALERRRERGIHRRLTTLAAESPFATGEALTLFGENVGAVVNAGAASLGGSFYALALVDVAWAHPGIVEFEVSARPVRSVTPPVPNNRSLYVNPQQHAYATRDEIDFPPLFS